MTDSPSPFPPELRTAAIVPRWSVVWTMNRDTVATHSYFVTMYAYQIAKLIGWSGDMARLMFLALTHDLDETITGDIVSPVKTAIVDPVKAELYIREAMQRRMLALWNEMLYDSTCDSQAFLIIKAADQLDALLFLTIEQRMGKSHVFERTRSARDRFLAAWYNLPCQQIILENIMNDTIWPAIRDHKLIGGSGVD